VKRDHGGEWRDLSWLNISGVDVLEGVSLHKDHSNHGDPPWPRPLPLPLGAGASPSGPPIFKNVLFEDVMFSNVSRMSKANWAVLPATVFNLTLRHVHLHAPPPPPSRTLPPAAAATDSSPLGWQCITGSPNSGSGFTTKNVFYCEQCIAEDVQPPLVGTTKIDGREQRYNCSFVPSVGRSKH
jgi:hypothetical protein